MKKQFENMMNLNRREISKSENIVSMPSPRTALDEKGRTTKDDNGALESRCKTKQDRMSTKQNKHCRERDEVKGWLIKAVSEYAECILIKKKMPFE